jgi:protein O-GlcNAc transferase
MAAGLAEPAKAAYKHPMTAPPTTATLLQQGLFHHKRGELAQAMDRYTDVLRIDPQHADALYYVAVVACQEGQYSQGAELAKRAIANGPPQARVHNLLGQAHDRLDQPLEAIKQYDEALRLDPNLAEAHGNRAGIMADAGFPDEALKSYDRALALCPNPTDWLNRGVVLHGLGRIDEAIESIDKSIALDDKSPRPYFARAEALRDAKRLDEALADYERALKLDRNFAPLHRGRALVLEALGRVDDARLSNETAERVEKSAAARLANPNT